MLWISQWATGQEYSHTCRGAHGRRAFSRSARRSNVSEGEGQVPQTCGLESLSVREAAADQALRRLASSTTQAARTEECGPKLQRGVMQTQKLCGLSDDRWRSGPQTHSQSSLASSSAEVSALVRRHQAPWHHEWDCPGASDAAHRSSWRRASTGHGGCVRPGVGVYLSRQGETAHRPACGLCPLVRRLGVASAASLRCVRRGKEKNLGQEMQ